MKVKRLEIHGFKSFKDKTVIHFDDGVTGIVGPNGCGKSNIVDSFFWVMGEQSNKHMRAEGSLDLIFNGSEKYSPLNMAEVTIVLATGAKPETLPEGATMRDLPPHLRYEEISVTRRLYRNSESEYLINGQTCRLKDIHELFMDTGAGPKAYSIIEQGQISRIVASKPEDRRVLIEEAAGIVKFKARKKESLRKIEATRQNLLRINDIITEIERQLAFLERQATKARQYKKYKEELQYKELLVGRKKLVALRAKTAEILTRLQVLEITEVESRSALQTAELQIENLKIQTTEAQKLAEASQQALQLLQKEIANDNTKVQLHRSKVRELENSNMSLEEEFLELQENIASLQVDRANNQAQVEEQSALFASADQILKEKQAELEEAKRTADQAGSTLEQEKRAMMASLNRQTEISNQVHGLEARVDSLSVQVNQLAHKITDRELDIEILTEKSSKSKEQYDLTSAQAVTVRTSVDNLKTLVLSLEQELKQLRIDHSAAREDRAKTESKLKALQQLVDNHEGFRADVKNILKDQSFATSLKGIFADKVEAHPGYEFAIESVLRDFLESLFVDSHQSVQQMIQTLKDSNKGRASFWVADFIRLKATQQKTEELPEIQSLIPQATRLTDVIRIDHELAPDLLQFFSRYYVVDHLNDALAAFEKTAAYNLTFVTREGDLVDRYGRVYGGSTKSLEGGILARKAELQKLNEHLTLVSQSCDDLAQRLQFVDATLTEKKVEFDQSSSALKELDIQAKSLEKDWVSASHQLTVASNQQEQQKTEHARLDNERKEHWLKLDGIRIELSTIEGSTREKEQEIESKTQEHNRLAQRASELQGAIIQLKVDFASASEKLKHAKQNLERIAAEYSKNTARKEEVERLMNRKLDEKDLVAQELEVLEARLIEVSGQAQTADDLLKERKNNLEILMASMNDLFDSQRQAMRTLEESTSELSKLRLDSEKLSLEYQMLLQNLFEKYGLEEHAVAAQTEDEQRLFAELDSESEATMQAEVDRLKEKIRKLGEVNLMAVEEYDEQKKRHEFLCTQREDLNRSIIDLERAIERINKTSEERFKIAFQEINSRFERIFPIVFGGGWGKLTLTNPEDINETGVDIIAEPPGKKVGSIQLMSGGEKALTAVALIFSIFLIKPSPFCVLDEVDAPLDDHNVGKFNALLKEMAERSQFIIITHNKRTMELNDKLYGVTMEEPGVSKMVSIRIQ